MHIITWNVGSATPPDDITSLLGLNVGDGNTDMYIIGWVFCSVGCKRFSHIKVLMYVPMSDIGTAVTNEQSDSVLSACGSNSLPFIYPSLHGQASSPLRTLSALDPCALFCHLSSRLQEVNSMINKRLKDVLFMDQWSEVCMERLSPFGYVLVSNVCINTCAHSHIETSDSLDLCACSCGRWWDLSLLLLFRLVLLPERRM